MLNTVAGAVSLISDLPMSTTPPCVSVTIGVCKIAGTMLLSMAIFISGTRKAVFLTYMHVIWGMTVASSSYAVANRAVMNFDLHGKKYQNTAAMEHKRHSSVWAVTI